MICFDDVKKFLELYEENVKKWVRENPEVMYKTPPNFITKHGKNCFDGEEGYQNYLKS